MKHEPISARESTAAKLMDMPVSEFRRLVHRGALPRPVRIGDVERWSVADLRAVLTGAKISDDEFEP